MLIAASTNTVRRWAQLEESVARYLAKIDAVDRREPSVA
jgi:hypothetical protein